MALTCAAIYEQLCKEHGCKPHSALLKEMQAQTPETLECLDLSDGYVGNKGIIALCAFLQQCPRLSTLILRNINLYSSDTHPADAPTGNAALEAIIQCVAQHPSVTYMDLSENAITAHAGRQLLALVQQNTRIKCLEMFGTSIPPYLLETIEEAVLANESRSTQSAVPPIHVTFSPGTFDPEVQLRPDGLGKPSPRRLSVSAECGSPVPQTPSTPGPPKSQEDLDRVRQVLKRNVLFQHLEEDELAVFLNAMRRCVYATGNFVTTQGEPGDVFGLVTGGVCQVYVDDQPTTELGIGDVYGEVEIMYMGNMWASSIVAANAVEIWVITRGTYHSIMKAAMIKKRQAREAALSRIKVLAGLTDTEKLPIVDSMQPVTFCDAETIIVQGATDCDTMFMILDGLVIVERLDHTTGEIVSIPSFGPGDYFGEIELLTGEARVASCYAQGTVKCLTLSKADFERHAGPIRQVMQRTMEQYEHYVGIASQKMKGGL
mmetsp:Transcript_40772/g.72979  ORF Transcript_40772/g.72979 Transcript_40772/m.72979 type:complete len:489 (-) Transcript_40772:797-2263(-)